MYIGEKIADIKVIQHAGGHDGYFEMEVEGQAWVGNTTRYRAYEAISVYAGVKDIHRDVFIR